MDSTVKAAWKGKYLAFEQAPLGSNSLPFVCFCRFSSHTIHGTSKVYLSTNLPLLNEPNVGKYTILGWYGIDFLFASARSYIKSRAVCFFVHVVFLVTGACLLKKGGWGALCFLWKGRSNKENGGFVFYKCVPSTARNYGAEWSLETMDPGNITIVVCTKWLWQHLCSTFSTSHL